MALVYKLVGFDRVTESLALSYDIPRKTARKAKTIAGIAGNLNIIADWPLSRDQAGAIAQLIGEDVDLAEYDWSLEPYQVP
jgi:hypothetical protein